MQCIKTLEWLKRIIAALTGDAETFINKDCRVLFGDIFIVPFLSPALGQQFAARGGEIWLELTGMICPWAGNLTANFCKSPPHALPLPPPPPAGLTLISA